METNKDVDPAIKWSQLRAQRRNARDKAAAANRENDRLREEIRTLRLANFALQQYIDNPKSGLSYKRRYEQLLQVARQARDLLAGDRHTGLPEEEPKTLEKFSPPQWARAVPTHRVTDEQVDAAIKAWWEAKASGPGGQGKAMRAALEGAWEARKK